MNALEQSIRKWEQIAAGEDVDRGTSNCALCDLYHGDLCEGCPVFGHTGERYCGDTPYQEWVAAQRALRRFCMPYEATTPELVEIARLEIEFLKSLREAYEK